MTDYIMEIILLHFTVKN